MNVARLSWSLLGAASIALISTAALVAGCSGDQECASCDPCGPGGNLDARDGITIASQGVDSAGTPAIELWIQKPGVCVNFDSPVYWMRFSMGAVSLEERAERYGLERAGVTYDGKYHWTGKDLAMSVERSGTDLLLEFQEGMTTTLVVCRIESDAITCSVSAPEDA